MTRPTGLERHPDILELRDRYERASCTPAAQAADGLTMLSGLYLAISPWVVGFHSLSRLSVSNLVTGLALAALGLGLASAYGRMHGLSWMAPLIGVWTIIAPWIMHSATRASIWSNVVTGIVILLAGLGAMAVGMRQRRRPEKEMFDRSREPGRGDR
ncbi:SPW repeat protein [Actinomadura sp. HBU206391]|uniref:SPW repeat protein n=1 Tax=Actinomadura sp. HBU206391 TaxID=2731692 RepID=UPI00164F81E8|nr:SPW repeat protein [Actinomadura sp. HBU206391]MBC6462826.1 SPW repeat protein [Actinomadura sp. HBU206391]